ncbi:hypothetical protein [Rhizobium sp. G21]|uniref:hypothetical protein n=1 Tax=Rhizobium sp. G21 TaxID=2758439 RepID=UPI0015FED966|nr:hypothetical protein [Rhizobium sp. G21]MBB1247690.1 hypothetical protein [Rhizobium sp. G21]
MDTPTSSLPEGRYEERYLAFIDVLGFSDMIRKTREQPKLIAVVHEALVGITTTALSSRSSILGIQATSFSDNVVISLPLSGPGLFHLFGLMNNFSQELLGLGMLFRGAIAKGAALHTEDVIFGPALVEAYNLETKVSLHPRIMLSDPVLEDAKRYAGKSTDQFNLFKRLVREDPFDVPYLNFFTEWEEDDVAWQPGSLAKLNVLRVIIERGLTENAKNPNVAEKYRWMARQLDQFVMSKRLGAKVPKIEAY